MRTSSIYDVAVSYLFHLFQNTCVKCWTLFHLFLLYIYSGLIFPGDGGVGLVFMVKAYIQLVLCKWIQLCVINVGSSQRSAIYERQ